MAAEGDTIEPVAKEAGTVEWVRNFSSKQWRCCAAGGASCFTLMFLLSLVLSVLLNNINLSDYATLMPGDEVRRLLKADIEAAIKSKDWSQVSAKFTEANSGLIVGDMTSGAVLWQQTNGWADLDREYAVASQTKVLTALTINGLMKGTTLTVDSMAKDWIDTWPKDSTVTLTHLMGFTTGWKTLEFDGENTCARKGKGKKGSKSWEKCVEELSNIELGFVPGEHFAYGPWHLVIAAAMAHKAAGKPLTTASWLESVKTHVYLPSGITAEPRFEGIEFDMPTWMVGPSQNEFPDFSGGATMSATQWQKIMAALSTGKLLDPAAAALFLRDTSQQVKTWAKPFGGFQSLNVGAWHYAQGHWISCDAAAEEAIGSNEEADAKCGAGTVAPTPHVHHSVGFFGCYAFLDLTNSYYGVFIHSWAADFSNTLTILLVLTFILTPFCGCGCVKRCLPGTVAAAQTTPAD